MGQVFTATGIEIQDSLGSTVVDTTGVTSTLNFGNGIHTVAAAGSTSSFSYTNAGGSIDIALARTANVYISYFAQMANLQAGVGPITTDMSISINGTDTMGPVVKNQGIFYQGVGIIWVSGFANTIVSLPAGTHTALIRYKNSADSGQTDAYLKDKQILYLVLGK